MVAELGVVGLYLLVKGKLLFLQRPSNKRFPNKWSVPGGKVDPGETSIEAVIRETLEETGIDISSFNPEFKITTDLKDEETGEVFEFHHFFLELDDFPEVKLNEEHQDFCWLTPEEGFKLDLIFEEENCIKRALNLQ